MPKGYKYPGPIKSDNDPIYEDTHGMTLTMNQMADRLVNVEMTSIFKDKAEGDVDTLAYLLENGFATSTGALSIISTSNGGLGTLCKISLAILVLPFLVVDYI